MTEFEQENQSLPSVFRRVIKLGLTARFAARLAAECQTERGDEFPARRSSAEKRMRIWHFRTVSKRSVSGESHALMSFETRCPVLEPLWLLPAERPIGRVAGWDSHPLKIADFHGILV